MSLTWLDNRIRRICRKTCGPKGVKLENRVIILPDSKELVVPFPNEPLWHTGGYISPGHPTRVKIPAGFEGRYHVLAAVEWALRTDTPFTIPIRDGSSFVSQIIVNGDAANSPSDPRTVDAPVSTGHSTTQTIVWETKLTADDFLELHVAWHDSEMPYDMPANQLKIEAWLTVRKL